MTTAPNVTNYYIGKGDVYFRKEGETDYRHLGNVPTFEFTPAIEKLEHFSSRSGVKSKDRTVVLQKSASAHIILEEWNTENLALAFLGDVSLDTDGNDIVEIFGSNAIKGALKFVGQNEIGPKVEIVLPVVEFIPGQAVSLIGDTWGTLDLTGDVSVDETGSFGKIKKIAEEGGTEATVDTDL